MRDHPVREGERRDPAVYWLHQLIEKVPPVKQSIHIKIPLPLHGQLKSLAAKRNVTMTALLSDFVRQAIGIGELADETPGFEIRVEGARVIFDAPLNDTDGDCLAVMTAGQSKDVASTLEEAAATKNEIPDTGVVVGDGVLVIRRVGTAVAMEPQGKPLSARRVSPQIAPQQSGLPLAL